MNQTVNLEPSPDGYEQIARVGLASCADDLSEARRASALRMLAEVVHVVGYLATLADGAKRVERLKLFTSSLAAAASRSTAGRQPFTCPEGGALSGCGSTFYGKPDRDGTVDCPECGIWFTPAREVSR